MSIERRLVIGLITSTEFIRQVQPVWNVQLLESQTARRLAMWCMEYFNKYSKAPGKDVEGIYYQKLKEGLSKNEAEEIEQDILPSLSEEYEQEKFNLDYLLDQTFSYLKERHLTQFSDNIHTLLGEGKILDAERAAVQYHPLVTESGKDLDLSSEISLKRIEKAFREARRPIIYYPGALGEFWNTQLIRGSFVALMSSEKRGKTFWLLDMAIRSCRQGAQVAFFQAGDMTENQQLKRICTYLTKKSHLPKYSGLMYESIRDCIFNQLNDCEREERECDCGLFRLGSKRTQEELRSGLFSEELIELYKENKDYSPCTHCKEYEVNHWGVPWLEEVDTGNPLTVTEAKQAINTFFISHQRRFKLSSHANGTLSVTQIKTLLDTWEKQDNFIPDLVVVDYADLLVPEVKTEFRHQQNEIWKGLRNLSQERHNLVVTATQADARSYEQDRLKLSNFSEDKRKYAHVTACYGLNQDTKDREKKIGLMRINEIVVREGDFSNLNEVTVLQNLRRGRPFLGSYW